mmetsp:Transcript_1648/g.4132  ORF Transcript_1648/g.4132 Transcript_1648/m.4132 type:complete len:209 (-) Transcript_1648:1657-2283(-)
MLQPVARILARAQASEPRDKPRRERRVPIAPLHTEDVRARFERAVGCNLARQPVDGRLVEDVELAVTHGEEQRGGLEHALLLRGVPSEQRRRHHLCDRLHRRGDQLDEWPRDLPRRIVSALREGAVEVHGVDLVQTRRQRIQAGKVDRATSFGFRVEMLCEQVCVQEEAVRLCRKRCDRGVESRRVEPADDERLELTRVDFGALAQLG